MSGCVACYSASGSDYSRTCRAETFPERLSTQSCGESGRRKHEYHEQRSGTQIFHGPVYNISGNATIVSDLGKVMRPLDKGVDEVKFIVPGKDGKQPEVTIATKEEKEALIPSVDDFVEEVPDVVNWKYSPRILTGSREAGAFTTRKMR